MPATRFSHHELRLLNPSFNSLLVGTLTKVDQAIVKSADLAPAMGELTSQQRTYQIRKLVERRMLIPQSEGARSYYAGFANSYLLRGVMIVLQKEGFIPSLLEQHN